jgi:hypothetical protein
VVATGVLDEPIFEALDAVQLKQSTIELLPINGLKVFVGHI